MPKLPPPSSLDRFSLPTRRWFETTFEAPTAAQEQGWAAISKGRHTLLLAPTGSGKTLAAFLWALDRLASSPPPEHERDRLRVLYVSPLKALTYDVERNLRAPLTGIGLQADETGASMTGIRVGSRTGDTSQADRRDMVKHPPDILVTTPESLYLMLTSAAREVFASVEYVIVDEIHAVAGTKRGAHLALTLERLEGLTRRPPQRIGLSATQRPLDEVARFLGGKGRDVAIVDAGVRKPLELEVVVPVDDMSELGRPLLDDDGRPVMSGAAAGDPSVRASIWPSMYPVLLDLVRSHTSTIVFVNSRSLAERLAGKLNELHHETTETSGDDPPKDIARAHHGSLAREQRVEIEDALKAGRLPVIVATSSLELGIDMGAVDLVVQVQSPASVASGLQRIGRAGHQVGEPSKGKIFPKFRGDVLVAAVVAQRMHAGLIEETKVPRNPLDVLAQQIVAMAAMDTVPVDDLYATVTRAYPFADLTRDAFEAVLDMLAGRYPSDEFAELKPRLVWDRVAGTVTARPGARMLAVTSGGTIPDRGLYGVFTPDGNRVGELDEEMVYESRVGQVFVLGATSWRIEDITRDRVVVTPAPGEPGTMPFWRGDAIGRPYELGRAIGEFLRHVDDWTDERLHDEAGLDALAVANLRAYVDEEREATGGVLPTDRQVVVERFRDELGDWRLCILTPFGARVHAPWAMAIEAAIRERLGLDLDYVWGDDGIVLRLPESDETPPLDAVLLDPDEIEDKVVEAVGGSALFAGRFRENAARALLLPRRRPGQRTPLWQMRQRASDLQAVASRYGSFPVLLETYRECLRDVFDLPGLQALLRDIRSRKVRVVSVDTMGPSPFAGSLVWSYVHAFYDQADAPLAERRAQVLTLDRRMLAQLVGAEGLRDLLDRSALEALEADLQALDERRWARHADDAHDLLRRLGDLTADELRARSVGDFADDLLRDRRAAEVRVAGETRLIAIEDAGRYRDALGASPPRGIPDAFLEPVPDALDQLIRRWARTHGPFQPGDPAARFGLSPDAVEPVLGRLVDAGTLVVGEFRPEGHGREWCDTDVLRQLRQRSLAALRKEVEPVEADVLARFLPAWHGIGRHRRGAGVDRLYEVVTQLQGAPIPASVLERDVLSARVPDYTPRLLDELLAAGEVMWIGAGPLGRDDGKVVLHLRENAGVLWRAPSGERPDQPEHERLREVLVARGACFFRELGGVNDSSTLDALWDLVWAGEVTNDSFAPVRAVSAKRRAGGASRGGRPRLGALTALGPPRAQGRWSLVSREVGEPAPPTAVAHGLATVLLERHGVLTREAVRGEGVVGGFAGVYPVLRALEESGRARRGYFVAGLGGAQFAVPGAVDRLRGHRDDADDETVLLAATDPANPFGVALAWPAEAGGRAQRAAGAYVVLVGGRASLYVERGGKGLLPLRTCDGTWEEAAIGALGELLGEGRFRRLNVADPAPALEAHLAAAGFVPGPKGLVRYA